MSELLEKQTNKQAVKPPAMWNVIFVNDDFTTFEFVQVVMMAIFNKSTEQAYILTKSVHESGKAVVGQYSKDIAETKRDMAIEFAKEEGHPLNILLEQNA